MDPELKAYLDGMRQGLMAHAEQLNQTTRQDLTQQIVESRQHAEQLNQETRVLIEAVHDDVRGVADGVIQANNRLDRLEHSMEEQFQQHEKRWTQLEASRPAR